MWWCCTKTNQAVVEVSLAYDHLFHLVLVGIEGNGMNPANYEIHQLSHESHHQTTQNRHYGAGLVVCGAFSGHDFVQGCGAQHLGKHLLRR